MLSFYAPCMAPLPSEIFLNRQERNSPVFVDDGGFKTFLNNFLQQKPEFFYCPY